MNIIAVDDEQFALISIENAIMKAIPGGSLSCFDSPSKAIAYVRENRVDVAFLDIEMGGMNGLQLAKHLKEIQGQANIVFTTGHSQYAADAYAMHACGYLLKPVSDKAVIEAMEYLHHPVRKAPKDRLHVRTFGNFEVFADGVPLSFARSKTKELFAYLVMRRGARCSNKEITSVIWEDKLDTPALQSQYRLSVSDLMNALQQADAVDVVIKQRGFLAVVPERISCDMYDFCDGDAKACNSYAGEFMAQYSWAEFTNAYLSRIL